MTPRFLFCMDFLVSRGVLGTFFEVETQGEILKRDSFAPYAWLRGKSATVKNGTSRVFCSSCILLIIDYAIGEADGSELCR